MIWILPILHTVFVTQVCKMCNSKTQTEIGIWKFKQKNLLWSRLNQSILPASTDSEDCQCVNWHSVNQQCQLSETQSTLRQLPACQLPLRQLPLLIDTHSGIESRDHGRDFGFRYAVNWQALPTWCKKSEKRKSNLNLKLYYE